MAGLRQWLSSTTGGLPRTFWYLWTGTLINRLGAFVTIFLAIYLVTYRDFSPGLTGLILGLHGLGGVAGVLVGGVLADRWGRRPTLLTAHLLNVAGLLGTGLVADVWLITAFGVLLGFGNNMVRPAFGAMMVDVVPDRDRLRAFSLNYWAINLGFACSAMLAGFVAEFSYLALFLVDAVATLLTALIIFLKVPESRPHRPVAGDARPVKDGGLWAVFTDRVFITFVALGLLGSLVFMQHISSLPISMEHDGLVPRTFGLVISLNGVLIVLGQLFVPRLLGGHSQSRAVAAGTVVMGVGFGLTAFADNAALYAMTVLIWTAGEMIISPSNSTLIAELSPAALRGRYQGVFSLAFQGAGALAPLLGGFLIQQYGDATLWLSCLVIALLAAAGHVAADRSRQRRAAELRTLEPVAPTAPAAVVAEPAAAIDAVATAAPPPR